jgi:hypothetical protein
MEADIYTLIEAISKVSEDTENTDKDLGYWFKDNEYM